MRSLEERDYKQRATELENQVYLASTPQACMKKIIVFGLMMDPDPDAAICLVHDTARDLSSASLDEQDSSWNSLQRAILFLPEDSRRLVEQGDESILLRLHEHLIPRSYLQVTAGRISTDKLIAALKSGLPLDSTWYTESIRRDGYGIGGSFSYPVDSDRRWTGEEYRHGFQWYTHPFLVDELDSTSREMSSGLGSISTEHSFPPLSGIEYAADGLAKLTKHLEVEQRDRKYASRHEARLLVFFFNGEATCCEPRQIFYK